jgi:hypothetical protein
VIGPDPEAGLAVPSVAGDHHLAAHDPRIADELLPACDDPQAGMERISKYICPDAYYLTPK